MARNDRTDLPICEILDEQLELSLAELCRACQVPAERVLEFVEHGVIEPLVPASGREPAQAATRAGAEWRFQAISIRRVRSAERLSQDLGVNLAGVALALDLLDELEALRARLRRIGEFDV